MFFFRLIFGSFLRQLYLAFVRIMNLLDNFLNAYFFRMIVFDLFWHTLLSGLIFIQILSNDYFL